MKVGDRDVYMVPALFLLKKSYNVSLKTNLILQAKQNQSGHKVTSLFLKEIQGKPILVRVSASFELARVPVFGSQLYIIIHDNTYLDLDYSAGYHKTSSNNCL